MMQKIGLLTLLAAAAALAACASTPQASSAQDAQAKAFRTHPSAATLYVYRPLHTAEGEDIVLYIDGRVIGTTLPKTFFRVDVRPGVHVLHGIAHDNGRLKLDARPGETYFVAVDPLAGNSDYALVDPEAARREIRACCALLENWAPGQRPLLR